MYKRQVPVHPDVLGSRAVECMPCIMQGFIKRPEKVEKGIDFDRRLYVVRRVFEQSSDDTYVASLSSRTIAYKEMCIRDSTCAGSYIYHILLDIWTPIDSLDHKQ